MTPKREKYLSQCDSRERNARNCIKAYKKAISRNKDALRRLKGCMDVSEILDIKKNIKRYKCYVAIYKFRLPYPPDRPKRCPFCGGKAKISMSVQCWPKKQTVFWAHCLACEAIGKRCETREEAATAWNKRK